MRRGDACERWTATVGVHDNSHDSHFGDLALRGRPCFATKLYVDAVLRLRER